MRLLFLLLLCSCVPIEVGVNRGSVVFDQDFVLDSGQVFEWPFPEGNYSVFFTSEVPVTISSDCGVFSGDVINFVCSTRSLLLSNPSSVNARMSLRVSKL